MLVAVFFLYFFTKFAGKLTHLFTRIQVTNCTPTSGSHAAAATEAVTHSIYSYCTAVDVITVSSIPFSTCTAVVPFSSVFQTCPTRMGQVLFTSVELRSFIMCAMFAYSCETTFTAGLVQIHVGIGQEGCLCGSND